MKQRIGVVIGVLGSLVVAALWWFVLWSPQTAALAEADEDLEQVETDRDLLLRRLRALQALKANEPALRAESARLKQAIPDQAELDQFLLTMNDVATKAGLAYPSISQSEPASGVMNVRVAVNGTYAQLLDYIDRLTALPRLLVIDTVSLGGADGGSGQLTANFSIRAFAAGAPAPPGPSPAPAPPPP